AVLPGDLPADRGDDARQLDLLIPELLQRRSVDLLEDTHLVAILLQRMAADEEAEDLLLTREPLRLRPARHVRHLRFRSLRGRVRRGAAHVEQRDLAARPFLVPQ